MTDAMPTAIHAIGPDDWQLLRDVRLRALADAPAAFGSRFEEQRLYPDSFWQEAASWRPPLGQAFTALEDGRAIGLVRVHCDPATPSDPQLISMWVEPAARGAGVGRALVERV